MVNRVLGSRSPHHYYAPDCLFCSPGRDVPDRRAPYRAALGCFLSSAGLGHWQARSIRSAFQEYPVWTYPGLLCRSWAKTEGIILLSSPQLPGMGEWCKLNYDGVPVMESENGLTKELAELKKKLETRGLKLTDVSDKIKAIGFRGRSGITPEEKSIFTEAGCGNRHRTGLRMIAAPVSESK
jgi:hypothetical protein